jgi:serine phosphatase RsbU (regulator of sigma subunit)/lipopolysaccharide biosynthesis regulator YciM
MIKLESIRNIFIILVVIAVWKNEARCQVKNSKTDSLDRILQISKDPEVRKNVYLDLIAYYVNNDPRAGIPVALRAMKESSREGNLKANNEFLYELGEIYLSLGIFDSALSCYKESAINSLLIQDWENYSQCLESVAIYFQGNGEYGKAMHLHQQAKEIAIRTKNYVDLGHVYTNIGSIYQDQEKYEKAMENFNLSLQAYLMHTDSAYLPIALNNIGICYEKTGELDKAEKLYLDAIRIDTKTDHREGLAEALNNLAGVYFQKQELEKCMITLKKSIAIKQQMGLARELLTGYLNLSFIYKAMHLFKEAEGALNYVDSASRALNSPLVLQGVYLGKAELFKEMKNDGRAYEMLREYITFRDSMMSSENRLIVEELEKKYENDKIKKQNQILSQDKLLKENQIEVQEQSQKILGGLLFFTLLTVVMIFLGYRNKKKSNDLLSVKNSIIEEKNKEIVDSIQYAKRLQKAILPGNTSVNELLPDSFILYTPKDIVAGDFYFVEKSGDYTIFAAADCTGHGVPGAMVSVVCSNALGRAIKEYGLTDPGKILDKVSDLVEETFSKSGDDVKDGMDISLCVLNPKEKTLQWSGANNPLWILRKNEENDLQIVEIKPDKQPVGKYEMRTPFRTHSVNLMQDDQVYTFTDGFADQFGGELKKKLKLSGMKKLLLEIAHHPMKKQEHLLNDYHLQWKGKMEQVDDICVIGVKIN